MLIGCYWSRDMNALRSLDVTRTKELVLARTLQNTCISRAMYKALVLFACVCRQIECTSVVCVCLQADRVH